MGTHPPFVFDTEEANLLVFNFVQSIVWQTQQDMFKQLEQCMQQAYSGLSIGTPIRAKEYTEEFKKNNNTVLLTETKRLDIATDESKWNDDKDQLPHRYSSPQLPPPPGTDNIETMPKTITPLNGPFVGARRKTGFTGGASRPTAVIYGHPGDSKDPGEYKDYFNPAIYPHPSLYTSNPVFAAGVNIRHH